LPKGWKNFKIGELSDQVNGKAFKPTDWSTSGVPIIRIQNLNNHKADFNYSTKEIEEKYYVKNGDLLFAWSGTPGTSFGAHIWERGFAYLNQHIFNIKITSDKIDKRFYYYAFKIAVEKFINQAQGTAGLAHITKGKFENTEIPVPSIPEQQRIVAKLDAVFGHLDRVREKLDRIPKLLINFRQQVLTQAVTGELTREWRERMGSMNFDGPIPIPSSWNFEVLNDLSESLKYGSSSKSLENGEVPVLRMGNIQNGEIDWTDLKFSSDKNEIKKYRLVPGNLLFNRTNSPELVGKTAIYRGEKEAIFAGYLIQIIPKNSIDPEYLNFVLNSNYARKWCWEFKSDGVSQSNINATKLGEFLVPTPSLEEQVEIVRVLQALFEVSKKIESQYQSLKAKIDQMPQAILAKAFRGELVGQEVKEYVREVEELGMVAKGGIIFYDKL